MAKAIKARWPQQAPRPYYYLLCREPDGIWTNQFGDSDRNVVEQERIDTYLARWRGDDMRYVSKDTKIIRGVLNRDWINKYLEKVNSLEAGKPL